MSTKSLNGYQITGCRAASWPGLAGTKTNSAQAGAWAELGIITKLLFWVSMPLITVEVPVLKRLISTFDRPTHIMIN